MRQTRYIFLLLLLLCNLRSNAEELDTWLHDRGLVDISVLDSTIRVHLVYATPDNFMGETVYTGITRAWLHPDAAQKLVTAQRLLKKEHPDLTLVVYDAARPMSVQRKMWRLVRGTDKVNYVSNPSNGGGLHNYGMAVDVTILDPAGGAAGFREDHPKRIRQPAFASPDNEECRLSYDPLRMVAL